MIDRITLAEEVLEVGDDPVRDVGSTVAPGLGRELPPCGPSLVGEIGDAVGEVGIAARFDSEDLVNRATEEDRLQHHLVPFLFREVSGGEGVLQREGVEDIDNVRAQYVDGRLDKVRLMREQRKG